MKHLEEAFAGTWHLQERAGEVGTGAGDTAERICMNLSLPLFPGRKAEDWVGRELISLGHAGASGSLFKRS